MNNIIRYVSDRIATIQFWIASKRIKEGVAFRSLESRDGILSVELLKGKYKGTIVNFTNFAVSEYNGQAQLDFETHVIYNPNLINVNSKKLERLTTNIVRCILQDSIEKVGHEGRTNNTVELDEERELREESAAFFEEPVPDRKPRKKTVRSSKRSYPKV